MKKENKTLMFWGTVAVVFVVAFFAGAYLGPSIGLNAPREMILVVEDSTNPMASAPVWDSVVTTTSQAIQACNVAPDAYVMDVDGIVKASFADSTTHLSNAAMIACSDISGGIIIER